MTSGSVTRLVVIYKMINPTVAIVLFVLANPSHASCNVKCPPEDDPVCGFNALGKDYTMFPGSCAMLRYKACNKVDLIGTPLYFCIKNEARKTSRRYYEEESCPVFCPQHYRPVCAASRLRSYVYRSFTNGCQLDMLNCRGEDWDNYVEVPLSFCPNHGMRNIFKDQIIATF